MYHHCPLMMLACRRDLSLATARASHRQYLTAGRQLGWPLARPLFSLTNLSIVFVFIFALLFTYSLAYAELVGVQLPLRTGAARGL